MTKRRRKKHKAGGKAARTGDPDTRPSSSQKQQQASSTTDPAQAGPSTSGGIDRDQRLKVLNDAKSKWQKQVQEWYPKWNQQTYFLPPVFMRRIQRSEETVSNQSVFVIQPPGTQAGARGYQDKDRREDDAHLKVLSKLEQLTEREVMLVISKLEFRFYLSVSQYEAAASMLPRPKDEGSPQGKETDGDFDILIIHRKLGLLAAEMKAVGDNADERSEPQDQRHINLVNRIRQATTQMQKSHKMLTYLVSRDTVKPKIRTILMLPNITNDQLRSVLGSNAVLEKDLRESLGVDKNADLAELCLTKDDVENPDFPWWGRFVTACGEDTTMTDSVYLDLISRFGGPATPVPVPPVKVFPSSKRAHCKDGDSCIHTKGNGVAETARRLAPREIVINHKQVDILTKHKDGMVFLTGPPGTGKTLVLIIKGLDWLVREKAVQVVSSAIEGKAIAHVIVSELKRLAAAGTENNITTHHFDMTSRSEDSVVAALASKANQGELYIIADEISRDFARLCIRLKGRVQKLHVWAASLNHEDRPSEMIEEQLTEALRTTPIITREVTGSGFMEHQSQVLRYTSPNIPPPCEGPRSISIIHDKRKEHSGNTTYDCWECGHGVAVFLNELHVGRTRSSLKYREVFVLTADHVLVEEERDSSGIMTPACGFLRGMRDEGIPVRVLRQLDTEYAIQEVATMTGPDEVVAADCRMVSGLERPVVVWLGGKGESKEVDTGRLYAMSRSTSQLIWVSSSN